MSMLKTAMLYIVDKLFARIECPGNLFMVIFYSVPE